MMGCKLWSAWP